MSSDPGGEMRREPRAVTMLDLVLLTVGVACASALPSGLGWFDPNRLSVLTRFEFATSALIWTSGLGAVGLAFVVIGRHAVYQRMASPVEWLAIILAARYLALALTQLHVRYGSASILVTSMERGLQAEFGPIARLAFVAVIFLIVAIYVGILFRYANLKPFVRSLLGTAVALLWYWGPCAVWAHELTWLAYATPFDDMLFTNVLLPALPLALPSFVVGYWVVFSRHASRRWTHIEFACMMWFVGTVALMYFHPAVQYYSETKSFFFELVAFAFIVNLGFQRF